MGLLGFIGKSKVDKGIYKSLEVAIQQKNYHKAFELLEVGFLQEVNNKKLLSYAIQLFTELGQSEAIQLFNELLLKPRSFDTNYGVGRYFFDVEQYSLALPFLKKSVDIDESQLNGVHDLAVTHARLFNVEEGLKTLQFHHPKKAFWNYWYWAKLSILNQSLKGVDFAIEDLTKGLDAEEDQTAMVLPRLKIQELEECQKRYQLIKEPNDWIQDWHFIQYGGVVLDYNEQDVTQKGRYKAALGTYEKIKAVILRLIYLFDQKEIRLETVFFMPNKNAEIIAKVIAQIVGCKLQAYDGNVLMENSHLIVGASTSDFNKEKELQNISSNQYLFAMNHTWVQSATLAPELIGFMSSAYRFPWESNLESVNEIAERVVKAQITLRSSGLDFYLDKIDYIKSFGAMSNKHRYAFMIESPVLSGEK